MSSRKKVYDDDDGRTIFDMSGVEDRSAVGAVKEMVRDRRKRKLEGEQAADLPDAEDGKVRESWLPEDDKKVRHSYILGAMGAALLIGLVFVAAFAVVIILMLFVWHVL